MNPGREGVAHRCHSLGRGWCAVLYAEAKLEQGRRIDKAFRDELPGELDVPEFEDLDLGAHARPAVLLSHVTQISGRSAVQGFIKVQRSAVEASDLRQ